MLIFPTLIRVGTCIPPRLFNEVLYVGFGCENTIGVVNWPIFCLAVGDRFDVVFQKFFFNSESLI